MVIVHTLYILRYSEAQMSPPLRVFSTIMAIEGRSFALQKTDQAISSVILTVQSQYGYLSESHIVII